jgi:hypothetical protein
MRVHVHHTLRSLHHLCRHRLVRQRCIVCSIHSSSCASSDHCHPCSCPCGDARSCWCCCPFIACPSAVARCCPRSRCRACLRLQPCVSRFPGPCVCHRRSCHERDCTRAAVGRRAERLDHAARTTATIHAGTAVPITPIHQHIRILITRFNIRCHAQHTVVTSGTPSDDASRHQLQCRRRGWTSHGLPIPTRRCLRTLAGTWLPPFSLLVPALHLRLVHAYRLGS